MNQYWDVPTEWQGQTAFIIAGGTSVKTIDLEQLRGQRVIAINSSWAAVPFADYLIFADSRWWEFQREKLMTAKFAGRIVSCSQSSRAPQLLRVRRTTKMVPDRDALMVQFTTSTAAIDLAVKLGAARIVLLGLDGKVGADGKTHHHKDHPWRNVPGWEGKHRRDFISIIEPLRQLGIEICHGTPGSAYEFWPTIDLTSLLGVRAAA